MKKSILCSFALIVSLLTACNAPSSGFQASGSTLGASAQGIPASTETTGIPSASYPDAPASPNEPQNPAPTTPATPRTFHTDVLMFVGSGTWGTEVANLRTILNSHNASFDEVTSSEMNAMSLEDLAGYGVILFPGGAGGTEAGSLTSQTHANLRAAVQVRGVSYVGFCAGAFIAQAPAPSPGRDVSYGLGIVDGPVLEYYYLENQGQDIAMTLYTFADGSTADILYYGGPVTPNIPGGVVARYPNGDPSISEMWSGQGLVVIAGGHPTANAATLAALGVSSSDGTHQDVAWDMIHAGITQQPLPAFN